MKKPTTAIQRDFLGEFRAAFAAGIQGIVKAGEIYVAAIDHNPKLADSFREEFTDSIPAAAWGQFEAVGRKWLHPNLILGGGGEYATRIKRLPYSQQERVFAGERFDMLTGAGDTLKVDLREIGKTQADQMFAERHVRTLSEQKSWIEARRAVPVVEPTELLPYTISGDRVTFRRGATLTRAELKRLVMEV